jgi:hypothetical protein
MSSSRKHGGQSVHLGSSPDPLSIVRVDEVVEHQPAALHRYDTMLKRVGSGSIALSADRGPADHARDDYASVE